MPSYQELIIPRAQSVGPVYQQEAPQQPTVFVVNAGGGRREPRLKSGGWFARSFATTAGIIICLMVFFVGLPILVCMGCVGVGAVATQGVADSIEKDRAKVRKMAQKTLGRYGIRKLAEGGSAYLLSDAAHFSGIGLDASERSHAVVVDYRIIKVDGTTRWEVTSATIDGEEMTGG